MIRAALLAVAAIVLALPATAVGSASTQVRHIDFGAFPLVRVTALAPAGTRPALFENGRRPEAVIAVPGVFELDMGGHALAA